MKTQPTFFIYKNKFTCIKFSSLFPRNEKKICADQSILQVFLLCLKRNDSQTFKSNNCTKNVCSVCMLTFFNKCFLLHVISGRHCFLQKSNVTMRIFSITVLLLSLQQVLNEIRGFHFFPRNNSRIVIPKFQNEARETFLTTFIF